jgi:hypothetical protein
MNKQRKEPNNVVVVDDNIVDDDDDKISYIKYDDNDEYKIINYDKIMTECLIDLRKNNKYHNDKLMIELKKLQQSIDNINTRLSKISF